MYSLFCLRSQFIWKQRSDHVDGKDDNDIIGVDNFCISKNNKTNNSNDNAVMTGLLLFFEDRGDTWQLMKEMTITRIMNGIKTRSVPHVMPPEEKHQKRMLFWLLMNYKIFLL